MMNDRPRSWSWMLLFTTTATLTCCALPITLVALGLGSAVASMASAAPWLITLSMYKGWIFAVSGTLIIASGWVVYRPGRVCPVDPKLAAACAQADKWNKRFILISGAMWFVGFFSAFMHVRI